MARLQHDVRLNGVDAPLWFSKTDSQHGYWQIEVHPDDQPYLAFTVPVIDCSYQWCVMPMLAPFSNINRFKDRHVRAQGQAEDGEAPGTTLTVTTVAMGSVRPTAEGALDQDARGGWSFGTAFAYMDDVLICSMGSQEEHVALVDAVMASFA